MIFMTLTFPGACLGLKALKRTPFFLIDPDMRADARGGFLAQRGFLVDGFGA
jgi:hypothetical protein